MWIRGGELLQPLRILLSISQERPHARAMAGQGRGGGCASHQRRRDCGHHMDRWHDRRAASDAAVGDADLDSRQDRSGDQGLEGGLRAVTSWGC